MTRPLPQAVLTAPRSTCSAIRLCDTIHFAIQIPRATDNQVHSRLRTARLRQTPIARIILAGALTLALLAGIAPLNALSSEPACSMPCCASVARGGACATGACHSKLSGHSMKAKPPVQGGDAPSSHCSSMKMEAGAPVADTGSSVQSSAEEAHSSSQHPATQDTGTLGAGVIAGVLTKPCPSDCCAGVSAFEQVRRSRDASALAHSLRPRPPDAAGHLYRSHLLPPTTIAWLRNSSPRGPPLIFS